MLPLMIYSNFKNVDGSTLYDALLFSFNMVDKTSILKHNNIYSLDSSNSKASVSNVYTKEELTNTDIIYDIVLDNKADHSNAYLKTEILNTFTTSNLLVHTKVKLSSADVEDVVRLVGSVDNNTFSIEQLSRTSVSDSMFWSSLVSIEYNVDTMHCKFDVDKTDCC